MFDSTDFDQATLMTSVFALIPILLMTLLVLVCRPKSESALCRIGGD